MINQKIKRTLDELRAAIRDADSQTIGSALKELDSLAENYKRDIDPRLLHFLQRRSYDKAAAFLDGEKEIPSGICGGRS